MNLRTIAALVCCCLMTAACGGGRAGRLRAVDLRCQYRTDPLGIDEASPLLSWKLAGEGRGLRQSAYEIIAAESSEALTAGTGDLWATGKVASGNSVAVPYGGTPPASGMRCYWKVRVWDGNGDPSPWSDAAVWETGLLDEDDWGAAWISDGKKNPERDEDFYGDDPAPLFRKEFTLDKPVARGRLYISGLGYYEAFLNGERVGDRVLDPGWTSYGKRVLYSSYDVTKLLSSGENCIGVTLGNGWYNPLPLRMWGRLNLREHLEVGRPRFIARLTVEYEDGTTAFVVSDGTWTVSEGPILRNSIYLGEVYDARREQPGWNAAGFDDGGWRNAATAEPPPGRLCAQPQPPIRAFEAVNPVDISQPKPGVFIFDMGENFTGWVTLRVKGPAGARVRLRYGELLHPDGSLNVFTSSCGQIKPGMAKGGPGAPELACQEDTYILRGGGDEYYTPRFTFHGFRYVEVQSVDRQVTLDGLTGLKLAADVTTTGAFECSDPLVNRIHDMVRRTFLSNIFSVQSDCPQRERFGYGGDIVPTCEAFLYNFDMAAFYGKVLDDFADAARPEGGMTETAPFVGIADRGFGGGTGPVGWTLAFPYLQERLYRFCGDERLLERHYDATRRLVEFIRANVPAGHIVDHGISDHESIDPKPTALTSTAFYLHHVRLLADIAGIIGRTGDAARYGALADDIGAAFTARFLDPGTGIFDSGTQACQAFALRYGLVPPGEREKAVDRLIAEVADTHGGRLSTGIFGTKYLLGELTRRGRADLAFGVVTEAAFPGWGWMLGNGATTLWEHWEFSDNVYSHNHPMFGSVDEWFYRALAGINPDRDAVGFDRIVIRPHPVGGLTWAKARCETVRGMVSSEWRIEDGVFRLTVAIPANTTATVYIPADFGDSVTESGKPLAAAEGVTGSGRDGGWHVCGIGSGTYRFEVKQAE